MKLHEQYYVEKAKVEKLIAKKNQKAEFILIVYRLLLYWMCCVLTQKRCKWKSSAIVLFTAFGRKMAYLS